MRSTLDSLVARLRLARRFAVMPRLLRVAYVLPVRVWQIGHRPQERRGLVRRAGRDAQVVLDADVADQHPSIQERLPRGAGVGQAPVEDEVRVAGDRRVAEVL